MNEVQEEACKDKFNCSQVNEAYYHALSMQGSFSVSSSSFFFLLSATLFPVKVAFSIQWLVVRHDSSTYLCASVLVPASVID